MKRITSGMMLALLLASLLNFSVADGKFDQLCLSQQLSKSKQKNMGESFPMPEVTSMDSYDWLRIENCSYISGPGQPMLPVKNLVFKLPEGSSITSTKVEVKESDLEGSYKVVPARIPVLAGSGESQGNFSEDPSIYNSSDIFPEEWFTCRHAHGLDEETMTRVEYVIVNVFPLRFLPNEKKVMRAESVSVTVNYVESGILDSPPELKNLIIASDMLEPYAIQLANYKNETGVSSRAVNTTWVYKHYGGIDRQEQIRNCIEDFVATYGIVYVTIFGDADQIPVRYAYVPDGQDTYTPTDLYYADLDGTWDDNNDGIYADQRYDNVDGIPDVYVGRISVSTTEYANYAVAKIINYTSQDMTGNWTKRVILAAGTGDAGPGGSQLGSAPTALNDYISNIVTDRTNVKLYNPQGNLTAALLISESSKGAAFLNFAGHGDPGVDIGSAGWLLRWTFDYLIFEGFREGDIQLLTNGAKLPVVTTMSCSTARFDDVDCVGEWWTDIPDKGGIAYFGATRIAWCYVDQWVTTGLMGEIDWRIYQAFHEGYTKLGQMWGIPVTRYVQSYIWNYKYASVYDVKTLMEFVMLGDPTLRIYNPSYPETLKVPENYPTIQSAINAAYDGDTVLVSSGTYYENVVVNKSLSLVGEDRNSVIIDANSVGTGINITSGSVTVTGFTVRKSFLGIYINYCTANNVSGNIVEESDTGIELLNPWNEPYNTVSGNLVTNNNEGIHLGSSFGNTIVGNNVTANYEEGIYLWYSVSNTISGNNLMANGGDGIHLSEWCYDNTIPENNVAGNGGRGILLGYETGGNNVFANDLRDNEDGIVLSHSRVNNISENNVFANKGHGIVISYGSGGNVVYGNNVENNDCGISLFNYGFDLEASNNTFCHNNFKNNSDQAIIDDIAGPALNTRWDDGYPSGGNYWSDCTDVDAYCGSYQNETGSDAIWDHSYVIDENNTDHYPLTIPWTPDLEWHVVLTTSKEGYSDTSRFGVRIGSTAEFDSIWDEADSPAPLAGVVSYLWYPNNPSSPADFRKLSTSMIPPNDDIVLSYKVTPIEIDGIATINWTNEAIASISTKYGVLLSDSVGTCVADMRKTTGYSFSAESDVTYTFTVKVFVAQNWSLHLSAGWNMVSFPVIPSNSSFASIFKDVGYYQVVTWSGTSYVDAKGGNATAGIGYWVLALSETALNVTGAPVNSYERDLQPGWSMIGSVHKNTVGGGTVFADYYQLVTWTGTSYTDAKPTGIEPGKGYWALVLEPTHIIVD